MNYLYPHLREYTGQNIRSKSNKDEDTHSNNSWNINDEKLLKHEKLYF